MEQRIAFFYLRTGGGHVSGATALLQKIEQTYPDDCVCIKQDGFDDVIPPIRFFFEKGYSLSSNYFELGFVFFYQLTSNPFVLRLSEAIIKSFISPYLRSFLRKEKITKVVCLHEILIPLLRKAIDVVNPRIPLISIVMDPFTAHPIWFYEKQTELIVFSEKIRQEAIRRGFSPDRVYRFPLILSEKFDKPYTEQQKNEVRERLQIPKNAKVVLIAGGGEGLKKAIPIVKAFIKNNFQHHLLIVCGKNKILKANLERLVSKTKNTNIKIFGFISFMPDLINISDCVIGKSGPATIMEVLSVRKPLIISSYVRGQELGNMLYVCKHNVGWYLTKPKDIVNKTTEILSNASLRKDLQDRIKNLEIRNGLTEICEFIYHYE
ncbi:glycosyltransferase [Treponema phagedenis]|uniref:Glycosyltransferase n=1 Tax=Treponema phagedenis TaxID=162 RepID=A0A0B7GTH7_TREPH|nr:glycosyltransferase [Treponema phagedenis]NVP24536.1 glycosyltransferase [Treponema phagedenis]QEJ94769.1 glycosyltransferase [Treponema phagedenis]QEJ97706.1 glycosyltransferase [Treponema phagedenis]QEK00675.1 glycosyltransferase [Treponema phagedenis]QEK03273.1 glycosyltransferase [Treponema phagedenis]